MRAAVLVAIALASRGADADALGHERLRAHVATMDISQTTRAELDTSRAVFMATALVPGWGTYRLEKIVFGGVRPAGVVGDWILGGALPAGLAITALAVDDPDTRRTLAWTAVGLYAGTRIAIFAIGNLHISAYRQALDLRFAPAPGGITMTLRW